MKTVIVSGGFDPLHEGHIELIARARSYGDRLVVLLNSDEWLIRKKGYALLPFKTRQAVLRAMRAVDWVQGFDDVDGTAREGLNDIVIESHFTGDSFIFINGGDRDETIPEFEWCATYDVMMEFGVGQKIASSSDLMRPYLKTISELWGLLEDRMPGGAAINSVREANRAVLEAALRK